jgi:polar amino acid transport system permease protein
VEKHLLLSRRHKQHRITALDIILTAALIGAAAYFVYRVRIRLSYNWHWGVIPQYLFRWDEAKGRVVPNLLADGFLTTIKLSLWASVLAVVLGTVMGILRTGKGIFSRVFSRSYVELVRNLPPLVLVFIFYFFFSSQILTAVGLDDAIHRISPGAARVLTVLFVPPSRFSAFIAAVFTLGLYEGAYITEIIRAGIESVEKGQWEAAYAVGLSPYRKMRHVILPQAARKILPPLAGQFISTIKDSAIVSVISIQELTFEGMELMSATHYTFEIWLTITAMYFIITLAFSVAVHRMELRLRKKLAD